MRVRTPDMAVTQDSTVPCQNKVDSVCYQWRSQNAENYAHQRETTGSSRGFPFQNGNYFKRKEFTPRGSEFFPLRAVPYGMENHFNLIR